MARDKRKRQAKLLAKRHKANARHKALAEAAATRWAPGQVPPHAWRRPLHECLISDTWRKRGLAQVLLARRQPNGNLAFGVYLVDIFCLGLKNTFCNVNVSELAYREGIRAQLRQTEPFVPCPADLAHTVIYGAIDYAAQYGFQPDKDFKVSRRLLEPQEQVAMRDDVEFGKNGKPFYISGPHDDVERITRQLGVSAGTRDVHYDLQE